MAFTVLSAVLFLLNRRVLGGLNERYLAASAGRALVATAGMSLVIWGSGRLGDGRLLNLGVGAVVGVLVYLGLNLALGGQEIPALLRLIRRPAGQSEA